MKDSFLFWLTQKWDSKTSYMWGDNSPLTFEGSTFEWLELLQVKGNLLEVHSICNDLYFSLTLLLLYIHICNQKPHHKTMLLLQLRLKSFIFKNLKPELPIKLPLKAAKARFLKNVNFLTGGCISEYFLHSFALTNFLT